MVQAPEILKISQFDTPQYKAILRDNMDIFKKNRHKIVRALKKGRTTIISQNSVD